MRDPGQERAAGIPTPGEVGGDTAAAEAGERPDLTNPGSREANEKILERTEQRGSLADTAGGPKPTGTPESAGPTLTEEDSAKNAAEADKRAEGRRTQDVAEAEIRTKEAVAGREPS